MIQLNGGMISRLVTLLQRVARTHPVKGLRAVDGGREVCTLSSEQDEDGC